MKNKIVYSLLYPLYFIIIALGGFIHYDYYMQIQRTYSGLGWLYVIGGVVLVMLVFIIFYRSKISSLLARKELVILNSVFIVISLLLLIFSFTNPVWLNDQLRQSPDVFPYLVLLFLTFDVLNLVWKKRAE